MKRMNREVYGSRLWSDGFNCGKRLSITGRCFINLMWIAISFCFFTFTLVLKVTAQTNPSLEDSASYLPSMRMPVPQSGLSNSREQLKEFLLQEYPRWVQRRSESERETGVSMMEQFMSFECSEFDEHQAVIAALEEKELLEKRKRGVELRASYRSAPYSSEYDGTFEDTGARIGLVWNVLEDGFWEQRALSREIARRKRMAQLSARANRLLELYPCRDTLMMYRFGQMRLDLLRAREDALARMLSYVRGIYFSGNTFVDEVYDIEVELGKTRASIENYREQAQHIERFRNLSNVKDSLTVVDLNLPRILDAVDEDHHLEETSDLEAANVREKNAYIHDVDLEVFADYGTSRSSQSHSDSRDEVRFGVNLRLPLYYKDGKYERKEIDRIKQDYGSRKETLLLDILRRYNAYREKLNDALRMGYKEKLIRERLRRSMLLLEREPPILPLQRLSNDTAFAAGFQLVEIMDVAIEDLAVRESLARQILYLLTQAGLSYDSAYLKPAILESTDTRGRKGQRAVYIWSGPFGRLENKTILDFCDAKGVTTAIVSAGKRTDRSKLKEFLHAAKQRNVGVELLVGDNGWLSPSKAEHVKAESFTLYGMADTLHLDVEPQALPDFRSRRSSYWDEYLKMVRSVETAKKGGGQLAIALPPHVDEGTLHRLGEVVDHIYVMAYEITSPDRMKKTMMHFAGVPAEKLVVALRPKDFPDEYQLERFIDSVVVNTGINRFAFHEIEDYMRLASKGSDS